MKVITVKDMVYKYPDGNLAINGISFTVDGNETVGIIGPNGAGKTTLILGICGLIDVKGEIEIFGQKMTKNNAGELRKKMGLVFQNPDEQLFMPKVFDEVAFGPLQLDFPRDRIKDLVIESLSAVGLDGFEDRLTHHLSYGEKKRVALATVLALKPEILIFDEPTTNLDPAGEREFIELLTKLKHTKIIAGHNLEMIKKISDKIIVLNNGKKIAEGRPETIFSNRALLEQNRLI